MMKRIVAVSDLHGRPPQIPVCYLFGNRPEYALSLIKMPA